ncbi:MAG: ankyrin repeat domain-containing protein [bacterium]
MSYRLILPNVIMILFILVSVSSTQDLSAQGDLHSAADAGDLKQVEKLIIGGANVNARDTLGWTPLQSAIWSGNFDIAEYLVGKGADVNARNKEGVTVLMVATFTRPLRYIYKHFSSVATQDNAPYEGQFEIVKFLVQKGADVNAESKQGKTALFYGVDKGFYEIVEYLVGKGAKVDSRDTIPQAPLHLAAFNGDVRMVKLLLTNGARVDPISLVEGGAEGATPLMFAVSSGYEEAVKVLISNGANVNAKLANGKSVLTLAKNPDMIDILKHAGATE